ncbi:hypothetical protein Dda_1605 [Drechslerella dactyloides]|uniref:ribonuclease T2 n=1 Tax=Drechslerella dactyloides TaxID=74499 RepID=A0AAD6J2R7_DREDA|nr:hypothetical protein Dda_1605 [Drechslerella dactyloides]
MEGTYSGDGEFLVGDGAVERGAVDDACRHGSPVVDRQSDVRELVAVDVAEVLLAVFLRDEPAKLPPSYSIGDETSKRPLSPSPSLPRTAPAHLKNHRKPRGESQDAAATRFAQSGRRAQIRSPGSIGFQVSIVAHDRGIYARYSRHKLGGWIESVDRGWRAGYGRRCHDSTNFVTRYPAGIATIVLAGLAAATPLISAPRATYTVGPFNACSASDKAQTSCRNTTVIEDPCCIEVRGGLLLATQFWDAKPAKGPSKSWTVHGLWPDRFYIVSRANGENGVTGSYEGYCDPSREVTGDQIASIIEFFGGHNLLRYMRRYWTDNDSVNGSLWAHEYNKHATCFSSGRPECYSPFTTPSYQKASAPANGNMTSQKDVFDYFYRTTELFKGLDTYKALAASGIVPSATKRYTLATIQTALKKKFGVTPTVGCDKATNELTELWYHFHVKGGNVYDGEYLPVDGGKSFCNATGIIYTPKKA